MHVDGFLVFCILKLIYYHSEALDLVPEQARVNYENPEYIQNSTWTVRRSGRRAPYLVNVYGILLKSWGNNVTINVEVYEYHDNGYKKGFVRIERKFCDYLDNSFSGRLIRSHIQKHSDDDKICPFTAGPMHINNISTRMNGFPATLPFRRGRVDLILHQNMNNDIILNGSVFITVKD